jgi:hypothetical protein
VDFRKGQRLGVGDRLFIWKKGPKAGQWLKASLFAALPGEIMFGCYASTFVKKDFAAGA